MGGKWKTTNPKIEQEVMKERNANTNGLLLDTCKHMRHIRDTYFSSYHLPGIVIDSFVYQYIANWRWCKNGEEGVPKGTYEKNLYNSCPSHSFYLTAPGSDMPVDTSDCIDVLNKVLKYMSKDEQ